MRCASAIRHRPLWLLASLLTAGGTAACGDVIFDDEGDCSVAYVVDFTDSYNLLNADAFGSEVDAVWLYVLNPADGRIVATAHAAGDALAADGGSVTVDAPAGTYDLVAWCTGGTDELTARAAGDGAAAFLLPSDTAAMRDDLAVTLRRDASGTAARPMERLFHGARAGVTFPATEGRHRFTVPLVKDTHTLRVVLQHMDSSQPVAAGDFDITVTDSNGRLAWDNTLLADTTITYRPTAVEEYAAQIRDPSNPDTTLYTTTYSALAAEFSLARLVRRADDAPRLCVRRTSDGATVFAYPVIDLALLLRAKAWSAMEPQEFLDRQGSYECVFFLDERDTWAHAFIFINSWVFVLQNVDL